MVTEWEKETLNDDATGRPVPFCRLDSLLG